MDRYNFDLANMRDRFVERPTPPPVIQHSKTWEPPPEVDPRIS